MPQPASDPVVFWIDQRDDIVRVNDGWDRFALDNGAPELTSEHVLHRRLWEFIVDPTTRHLYSSLLVRVRTGAIARFPLRCDSPATRRRLEITVRPDGDRLVQFASFVLEAESRPEQSIWRRDAAPRAGGLVRACSWCKRVDVAGEWKEVEQAVEQLAIFEHGHPPFVTHGICQSCTATMESAIAKAHGRPL